MNLNKAGCIGYGDTNMPAFPLDGTEGHDGMSLRDWFAGQALANSAICTGKAHEYELKNWFGARGGITTPEIIAKQAFQYADAMLTERLKEQQS